MDPLHDLLNISPYPACLVAGTGALAAMNGPARQLFGVSGDPTALSLIDLLVRPEQLEALLKGFTGTSGQSEITLPVKSLKGREFKCRLVATHAEGAVSDPFLLWFEESPGKDKSLEAFQALFVGSDMPQLIVSLADGRVLRANEAAKAYFKASGSRSHA